jgi:two-component system sensor histidine kinase TctE
MRAIVQSIAATTDSTVHLANRLLTLARIEHGSEAAAMAPVSLLQIMRQVGLALALPAVQKRIDLSLEALDEVTIDGQAQMLHELVINLVDNAIRYTPAGGAVVLRVLRVPNGGALLEVEDSGEGIAEAEREKVFRPFYRSAASLDTNQDGTGLGLAIVRDVASVHRATIMLSAGSEGRGLKVGVTFPPPHLE